MAKARTRDDGLHDQYCESTPGIQRFLYDEAYHRQAAATGHTEWSKVNPSIFTVCFTAKDSYETNGSVILTTEIVLNTQLCGSNDKVKVFDDSKGCDDDEIKIIGHSKNYNPPSHVNVLQKLNYRKHEVIGDGNCLYYSVAHQAGFIGRLSRGDICIAKQLRMLALITMQKHPSVRIEDGLSQHQWEQKKLRILHSKEVI